MQKIVEILRTTDFPRELKLQIIDLLVALETSKDTKGLKDVASVLEAWGQADEASKRSLEMELQTLESSYESAMAEVDQKTNKAVDRIEEEYNGLNKVGDIKRSILEN